MSGILWRKFYLCFSGFKCSPESLLPPPSPSTTPPHNNHNSSSSPPIINPTILSPSLIKNFNSLFDLTSDSTSKSLTFFSSSSDDNSDTDTTDSPPDLAAAFASQRFFFSSPGTSNSIIDSPDSPPESDPVLTGGVAVQTYSPDPYADFRRSMQEMIESRDLTDVKANWAYLHELLTCYLNLNPKHTHKFIISAFTDLLISLMSTASNDSHRKHTGDQQYTDQRW